MGVSSGGGVSSGQSNSAADAFGSDQDFEVHVSAPTVKDDNFLKSDDKQRKRRSTNPKRKQINPQKHRQQSKGGFR